MVVKRSDMSWILVSDIKKAKEFFTNVLGLEMRSDTPEYGWIELMPKEGGSALGIGQYNPQYGKDVKPGENAIVTFTVDTFVATKALFQDKNVTLLGDIVEVPGHVKMLFFTDADGNKFQLVQVLNESQHGKGCC